MEFNILVKSLTTLAFVPPDEVSGLFEELVEVFPEEEACDDLLSYYKRTYVQGDMIRRRQRPPMFPIDMWNHYQDALDEAPKTTNCTEGWHNALKALFLSAHPSMWTMFRGLRKDIAIQKLVIIHDNADHADSPKPKYKKLAERLRRKVEKYPDELDKLKYLRAISHIQ